MPSAFGENKTKSINAIRVDLVLSVVDNIQTLSVLTKCKVACFKNACGKQTMAHVSKD